MNRHLQEMQQKFFDERIVKRIQMIVHAIDGSERTDDQVELIRTVFRTDELVVGGILVTGLENVVKIEIDAEAQTKTTPTGTVGVRGDPREIVGKGNLEYGVFRLRDRGQGIGTETGLGSVAETVVETDREIVYLIVVTGTIKEGGQEIGTAGIEIGIGIVIEIGTVIEIGIGRKIVTEIAVEIAIEGRAEKWTEVACVIGVEIEVVELTVDPTEIRGPPIVRGPGLGPDQCPVAAPRLVLVEATVEGAAVETARTGNETSGAVQITNRDASYRSLRLLKK